MSEIRAFKLITVIAIAGILLGGCATVPENFPQQPSCCWPDPQETRLGRFMAESEGYRPGLSGVQLVPEPDQAFNLRFSIASLAEHSLDMQYYLWKGDLSGKLLMWRALEAADRGVRVRFLIDDIYHAGRDDIYALLDSHPNMELRVFNPIATRGFGRYVNFAAKKKQLNHRMHNKIFLADNAVAVLGGRNIGNDYFGVDTQANFFDLDVLTTGEGARQAGAAFDEYWNSKHAVPIGVLHDTQLADGALAEARESLLASLEESEAMPYAIALENHLVADHLEAWRSRLQWVDAHVIVDPLERFEGQGESAIAQFSADQVTGIDDYFMVQSAYLIPSEDGLKHMAELTGRGVRVMVMTNSLMSNNHITAHAGYMNYRKRLLEAGVELYELRADAALREHFRAYRNYSTPAGIHTKSFVLDGEQALIGSFNFDPRSRDLNSEIGLLITDSEFSAEVADVMLEYFEPENAYRVRLDSKGKVRWEIRHPDGSTEVFTKEPGAPWWKRAAARFLSWMPIESEL